MEIPEDRKAGILCGLAVGDALGAPFQGFKGPFIRELSASMEGYADLARLAPDRPERRRAPGLHTSPAQQALSVAIALRIASANGENGTSEDDGGPANLAQLSLDLWLRLYREPRAPRPVDEHSTGAFRGAPRSLRLALQRATEVPDANLLRSQGAAMKVEITLDAAPRMAALACLPDAESADPMPRAMIELALLTHNDPRAVASAAAFAGAASALAQCATPRRMEPGEILSPAIEAARAAENILITEYKEYLNPDRAPGHDQDLSRSLAPLAALVREADDDLARRTLLAQAAEFAPEPPIRRPMVGFAPLDLPMALYHVLRAPSFIAGVEATLYEGGQTSLSCAMAGALLGARFGLETIPLALREGLLARGIIERLVSSRKKFTRDDAEFWIQEEWRWTREEEAAREALLHAVEEKRERKKRREKARGAAAGRKSASKASAPPARPGGEPSAPLPFAPPPEVWLRGAAPGPQPPAPPGAPRGPKSDDKKRIPWKEERRRQKRGREKE